jgi:BirA family biotin operon repressor/biotin-[acetyl-CoA-carboxylase] ligase
MAAAAKGAAEGSVFLAEEQTAGRGRGAHTWDSARSAGIYCSVVLRPALPPADVLVMALAAGLVVRAAIEQVKCACASGFEMAQRRAHRREKSWRHIN